MMFVLCAAVVSAATVPASPVTRAISTGGGQQPGNAAGTAGQVAELRARVAACNANMLVDTVASITVKGQLSKTRVLLCNKPGQTAPAEERYPAKSNYLGESEPPAFALEKTRIVGLMKAKVPSLLSESERQADVPTQAK